MPVHNEEISDTLAKIAGLLYIKGENELRIRAYRNAVQTVSGLSKSVAELVESGVDISSLSNIGDSIAEKQGFIDVLGKKRKKI